MFLDASALLAYLLKEPGSDRVMEVIASGARMTAVTFSEAAARCSINGATETEVRDLSTRMPVTIVPVGQESAIRAAFMISVTRSMGLSLGDRCSLAAASMAGFGALTADRAWLSVSDALRVPVELIR